MDLVIRISREDLLAALKHSGEPITIEAKTATAIAPSKSKPAKAPKPAPVEDDFDDEESEEEKPAKPAKKTRTKPAPVAPPVEEDEEESEEDEETEAEDSDDEEETEGDEDEFVTGDDLTKLKKALNAHKAANGGKPKKTLEVLRKFAPGGSEKVKPDVLPKLLKALKV